MKLFGTSGIRGGTFKDITPHLAERFGRAFGSHLSGEEKVAIGRDTRHGAEIIEYAVVTGLASTGLDVFRCGEIPTPALAHFINKYSIPAAVMITGSHMPPDRIGLIPMLEDGSYLFGDPVIEIEKHLMTDSSTTGLVTEPKRAGKIKIEPNTAIQAYRDFLIQKTDLDLIHSSNFRILVDSGNGTACHFATEVFSKLGCEVIPINDSPSGSPNRSPEPRADTLAETLIEVKKNNCHLGIAFDLDADRVLFLTQKQTISENLIGTILVDKILKETNSDSSVVLPINTSGLATQVIQRYSRATIHYCQVGQPATIFVAKQHENCVFAFEESGKYYFINEGILWTDGGLTVIRILEHLAERKISLDQLIEEYPKFSSKSRSFVISETTKTDLFQKIEKLFCECFEDQSTILQIDGLRANFQDGSWLLIRLSGTEPLIRVFADAPSESQSQKLLNQGLEIVNKVLNKR